MNVTEISPLVERDNAGSFSTNGRHCQKTERKIEMATYEIMYSVIGSGSIEIEAGSVKEAIKMFRKIDLTDMVDDVDFGSTDIEGITEDGEEVDFSEDD